MSDQYCAYVGLRGAAGDRLVRLAHEEEGLMPSPWWVLVAFTVAMLLVVMSMSTARRRRD
jgi:hypothetical protein